MNPSARTTSGEQVASGQPQAPGKLVLNRRQRERLAWIVSRDQRPLLWDGLAPLPDKSGSVIVLEPPTGPAAERMLQTLAPGALVVIPYGENPGFDFVKSKLVDFGTVGTAGAEGPHQLWWGGVGWQDVPVRIEQFKAPLVVARYAEPHAPQALKLARSAEAFGLCCDIQPADAALLANPAAKIDLVWDAWRRSERAILWVEPGVSFHAVPSLPSAAGCDFAVHRLDRWEFSAATLYFERSAAAEGLLRTWRMLAAVCPDVREGQLLDQAWSFVSSQMPLDTVWLPATYHAASHVPCRGDAPVVVHEFAGTDPERAPLPPAVRTARRAGRTGAPEAQMVMGAPPGGHGVVTVMIREVARSSAVDAAAAIEAAAAAFSADPGAYSQLELALCCWQDDVRSVRDSAPGRIVEVTPQVRLEPGIFSRPSEAPVRALRPATRSERVAVRASVSVPARE